MTQVKPHRLELVQTYADQDHDELITVADTLSILEQWVRGLPEGDAYEELTKQIRLAEIEARRLIDDQPVNVF